MSTPDEVTHVYRKTLGLLTHYDLGGKQPPVGRTAPDLRFGGGTRLGNLEAMFGEDGLVLET